jgi:hypothetical protein
MLRAISHVLADGTTYRELGPDYYDRGHAERTRRRAIHLLERQGYRVSSNPRPKDDAPDTARFSEQQATAKELIDAFQLRVYSGASATSSRQRSPLRIP